MAVQNVRFQNRRYTTTEWATKTLNTGELGFDTTTKQLKIGTANGQAWAAAYELKVTDTTYTVTGSNGITASLSDNKINVSGVTANTNRIGVAKLHTAADCVTYTSDDGGATPGAVKKAIITDESALNTLFNATSTHRGTMSKDDKAKLDAFYAASMYATKSELTNCVKTDLNIKTFQWVYSGIAAGNFHSASSADDEPDVSAYLDGSGLKMYTTSDLASYIKYSADQTIRIQPHNMGEYKIRYPSEGGTLALISQIPSLDDCVKITGSQEIDGQKTFKQAIYSNSSFVIDTPTARTTFGWNQISMKQNPAAPTPQAVTWYFPSSTGTLALVSQIPSVLKNPQALSITANGTTITYDGSTKQSITITSGGAIPIIDLRSIV